MTLRPDRKAAPGFKNVHVSRPGKLGWLVASNFLEIGAIVTSVMIASSMIGYGPQIWLGNALVFLVAPLAALAIVLDWKKDCGEGKPLITIGDPRVFEETSYSAFTRTIYLHPDDAGGPEGAIRILTREIIRDGIAEVDGMRTSLKYDRIAEAVEP